MSYRWLFLERTEPRFRWSLQVLFALFAPILADCIHSYSVLHRGRRLYNAELYVLFVGGGDFEGGWIGVVVMTLIQALLTFLVLWIVAKHPVRSLVVWICCVAVWTYLAFIGEVAVK